MKKKQIQFEITEADMSRLTGYTRQHLRQMRQGRKQVQGGKEYVSAPVLVKGADWVAYSNRSVFYSAECMAKLKSRKRTETVQD